MNKFISQRRDFAMKVASFFHHFFNIKVKFVVFAMLLLYIVGIFTHSLSTFRTNDPIPSAKVINVKMRKQFRDLVAKINVGLYIRNFSTFDFSTNHFVVDAMVWFQFNKNELPLKAIDSFSFENSKILHKSPPFVTLHNDRILVRYDIIFEVKTNVVFYRFPLEDHRLSIVLANTFITPNEMYFDDSAGALSFIVSKKLFTSNWKVHSLKSLSGYTALSFDQYDSKRRMKTPKAIFTINFQKVGYNTILLIFIPLFTALFLALFSFLMSFNNYSGKPTLGVTAVTALLGYRFVIQKMSPQVGYFTLTDQIFLFCLLFSFCVFVFQLLLVRHYMVLMEREKLKHAEQPDADTHILTPRITERINGLAYYIAVIIVAVSVSIIVLV